MKNIFYLEAKQLQAQVNFDTGVSKCFSITSLEDGEIILPVETYVIKNEDDVIVSFSSYNDLQALRKSSKLFIYDKDDNLQLTIYPVKEKED